MEFFTELSDLDCEHISGGQAYTANNGNALNAPGQVQAIANGDALLAKQEAYADKTNGAKAGFNAPENANHYFQEIGVIG